MFPECIPLKSSGLFLLLFFSGPNKINHSSWHMIGVAGSPDGLQVIGLGLGSCAASVVGPALLAAEKENGG